MESFDFGLRLVDGITSPGKRGVDAMRQLERQATKTREALDFGRESHKVEAALKKLTADPKGFVALNKAQRELREHKNKLLEEAGLKRPESFFGAIMSRFSFAKVASAAAVGELIGEGVMKVAESLVEGAHKAVELLTEGISKAFEESGKQETLRLGEKLSLGKGAGEFREDVGRFSKITGFDDDKIRALLLPARRAGFGQKAARSAFAAATDVAAGEGQGGNFGRVQELMQAFEHIKLKGGVQERLLPNLGVDVKGFYKDLGKSLHVGVETAKKRAEEGKVDPQLLLNTIFKGIEAKQGGQLGTGAIAYSKTFEARLAKVKNLPNEYLKGLVGSPAFARASELLGHLLDQLDPESPAGKRIMGSLEKMFDRIGNLLSDPRGIVDGIADGIENVIALVEQLLPALKDMGRFISGAASAMSDLVFGTRLLLAVQSGDKEGTKAILIERVVAQTEREANRIKEANDARDKTVAASMTGLADLTGLPIAPASQAKSGKVIQMHVTNHVTVHGVDGDTARKVGTDIHREAGNALERAAQEGG